MAGFAQIGIAAGGVPVAWILAADDPGAQGLALAADSEGCIAPTASGTDTVMWMPSPPPPAATLLSGHVTIAADIADLPPGSTARQEFVAAFKSAIAAGMAELLGLLVTEDDVVVLALLAASIEVRRYYAAYARGTM